MAEYGPRGVVNHNPESATSDNNVPDGQEDGGKHMEAIQRLA